MLAGCEGRKRDRRHRGGAQRRRPSLTLNTGRCLTLGSFPCDIDITCPLAPCDITMHHLSPHTLRQRLSSGQLVRNQPVGQLIAGADQDDTCWPVLIPQGSTNHLLGDCKKASLGFCAGLKGKSTKMGVHGYHFMDEVLLTQQGAC
jgi:hypothetical protein